MAAVDVLRANQGMDIPFATVQRALSKVKKLTGLFGRWDVLQDKPLIIADVGHNIAGITEVTNQWKNIAADNKHIVIGFVKDKDIDNVLQLLPKDNTYYFCNANIIRALPASELKKRAEAFGLQGEMYVSVADAVSAARNAIGQNDAVLITGSFFIVGEAIEYLNVNNGKLFPTSLENHH